MCASYKKVYRTYIAILFQRKTFFESKANNMNVKYYFVIIVVIIALLFCICTQEYFDNPIIIDLPDVDYFNFECGSTSVREHTEAKLVDITTHEILDKGGLRSDVDNMNLKIDHITFKNDQACIVRYHFNRPKNGTWNNNLNAVVIKEVDISYITVQPDTSPPYGYGYGYSPYYSAYYSTYNPYYYSQYDYQLRSRPWFWSGPYGPGGIYGGHPFGRGYHYQGW